MCELVKLGLRFSIKVYLVNVVRNILRHVNNMRDYDLHGVTFARSICFVTSSTSCLACS